MEYIIGKRTPTARALAREMGIRARNPERKPPRAKDRIINWGWTRPLRETDVCVNRPDAVATASCKTRAFLSLTECGVPIVPFTVNPEEALAWHNNGKTIYARTLTRGAGGRGIIVVRPDDPLTIENIRGVPLFTQFVKCDYECRAHVVGGEVIDFTVKKRRKMENPPPLRYWIRNHATGWVFAREGVKMPDMVERVACEAIDALGLDFGAGDMRVRGNKVWVLEVNTAPGLEGTTLKRYAEFLQEYLHG